MNTFDLCWLPSSPLKGISTYYVEQDYAIPTLHALQHELSCSFGACAVSQAAEADLILKLSPVLSDETFQITAENSRYEICGGDGNGLLYGLYTLIRKLQTSDCSEDFVLSDQPVNKIRMINHWDNTSGNIERGYAGRSVFFENAAFTRDYERIEAYARLLASIGINALSLNNVNVKYDDVSLIYPEGLKELKVYCDILHNYGIKPFVSINFASPVMKKELPTADPCCSEVEAWWTERARIIYQEIPYFGGFVVKADSEGEPGPYAYGRDHADGANMLARALKPYNGHLIWRCFVYNCQQDWRDRSIDRAKAAYEVFKPLDGKFEDNVTLQVKFGPIDFQIREPLSPLIGALPNTNLIVEFQITQEYTGQQRHICYLLPQWQEIMHFDTYCNGEGSEVWKLLNNKPDFGIAAVGSVGRDANWTGHKMAQANWYGFGRMAWNPALTSEDILHEWMKQTFRLPDDLYHELFDIMIHSREVYEAYTVPLGVGFMCQPAHHYGPNIDGYEYDRWGTYHFADRDGIGNNRTQKDGTGYAGLYHEPNRSMYEHLETCPDDVLLFFHHVPYTHVLHSGKTVVQHIYDTHFEGFEQVEKLVNTWEKFRDYVAEEDFVNVQDRLKEQLRCAREWRDQVNTYFFRKSGIADAHGREIYR